MSIISRYKPKRPTDKVINQPKFAVGELVKCGGWGPYIVTEIHEAWGSWDYALAARDWLAYGVVEPECNLAAWREGVDRCVE